MASSDGPRIILLNYKTSHRRSDVIYLIISVSLSCKNDVRLSLSLIYLIFLNVLLNYF